ncbi:hypothetical protein PR048_026768 [Dryococelus australis]|uniref:Uncharacterized protein n=1 Tax=Dryococelus australis TaxID=614101 RepID=A0ABQ9GM90_9NEOP|nr:hypothetical protein PR048_026768 [Dryococelus australis]
MKAKDVVVYYLAEKRKRRITSVNGAFTILYNELREDEIFYFYYFRMSIACFNELIGRNASRLQMCNANRILYIYNIQIDSLTSMIQWVKQNRCVDLYLVGHVIQIPLCLLAPKLIRSHVVQELRDSSQMSHLTAAESPYCLENGNGNDEHILLHKLCCLFPVTCWSKYIHRPAPHIQHGDINNGCYSTAGVSRCMKNVYRNALCNNGLDISNSFHTCTNFPLCIGALDGKMIQSIIAIRRVSLFFNYKHYFQLF